MSNACIEPTFRLYTKPGDIGLPPESKVYDFVVQLLGMYRSAVNCRNDAKKNKTKVLGVAHEDWKKDAERYYKSIAQVAGEDPPRFRTGGSAEYEYFVLEREFLDNLKNRKPAD